MEFSTEKLSGNKIKIAFTVASQEFDAAMQKAYLKTKGRLNVPGFRKGKAPRKLVESMYGESVFYDDALELIFPDAYQEAIKEGGIHPVDRPELDVEQMASGQELKFTAEVFVLPDVTLGEYKSLKAVKHVHDISDEQVDARIQEDIKKATTEQDVTDRPAKNGDIVKIDYLGTVEGEAFEGGEAKDQRLELGSNSFIPGFEQQVEGMSIDEERDLKVTFPSEYHATQLAGKDANFHVKLLGIVERVKPELDDEFAADVSAFDNFSSYREDIVKGLTDIRDKNAETSLENDLVQQAVDQADCDIPEAMITDELENAYRNWSMRLSYQGISAEDFMKYTGQTQEQIKDMMKPETINRVKTQLVLDAIAKAENIEVTQEDIDAQIAKHAEEMGRDLESYKETLNDRQREYYEDITASRKVTELLKENADISVHEGPAPDDGPLDAENILNQVEDAATEADEGKDAQQNDQNDQ